MIYLLDTSACIDIIRRRPSPVLTRLQSCAAGEVGVSTITVSELLYRVARSQQQERNANALELFLAPLVITDYDDEAARVYGQIRADLEAQGNPIDPLDTLIAAHAMSLGATLISYNKREFDRVPGLQVDDWAADEGE